MDEERLILSELLLLSHAVRRILQDEALIPLESEGVNTVRTTMLHLMARRGEQTVNMLACFMGVSKAAASQNVDRLVRLGFATRHPDSRDRRSVWVRITGSGKQLLRKAERRQRDRLRRFLGKISPELKLFLRDQTGELSHALLDSSSADPQRCLQCCMFGAARCIRAPAEGDWICMFARNATPIVARDSSAGTCDVD